jgi:protein-tyrosine phosphatase
MIRPAIALRYLLGAALFFAAALALGGIALLLCWPALALALVAFNYAWAGAAGFQKQDGRHSLAAQWLFAPYTVAAWVNSRLWTRRHPAPNGVSDGIWLGRLPAAREFADWAARRQNPVALLDLCAELPAPSLPAGALYRGLPCLDLVAVPAARLHQAVESLAALRRENPGCDVWLACALGVSRSASVAAAWLCHEAGANASARNALEKLRLARPHVVIGPDSMKCIETFCAKAAAP